MRRRLEEVAATLVERATGRRPAQHRVVRRRLLLLSAGVPAERWPGVHAVARQAASVYEATSAVLHSNCAFGDVPEHLVREWEAVVVRAESECPAAGA
ncbi:hypothetical protein [Pseudonocardia halophobica]|uniref:hypothetical protein n=1 Tax=Pseudonocardia halophobica TaxID=29401 RepID=UPI0012DC5186|nr:hypothetical protein [Pseudonocardia halophobica]